MIHNPLYNIYIASCATDGGIYQYHMYEDGSMKMRNFTQMDRPMYMAYENNKMHILLRNPFSENTESGLLLESILYAQMEKVIVSQCLISIISIRYI